MPVDLVDTWYGVRCDGCGIFLPVSTDPAVTVGHLLGMAEQNGWHHVPGQFMAGKPSTDLCPDCKEVNT